MFSLIRQLPLCAASAADCSPLSPPPIQKFPITTIISAAAAVSITRRVTSFNSNCMPSYTSHASQTCRASHIHRSNFCPLLRLLTVCCSCLTPRRQPLLRFAPFGDDAFHVCTVARCPGHKCPCAYRLWCAASFLLPPVAWAASTAVLMKSSALARARTSSGIFHNFMVGNLRLHLPLRRAGMFFARDSIPPPTHVNVCRTTTPRMVLMIFCPRTSRRSATTLRRRAAQGSRP